MILAILQARMSSSRLPGKVMRPLLGAPMIGRQIERLRRSRRIDRLVVATSGRADDDVLAAYCATLKVPVFRGSLTDVLARFHAAAQAFGPARTLVRLTGDCPLADWSVVDAVIDLHRRSGADYTNNTAPRRSFPQGLDAEAMTSGALADADRESTDAYEREHVTPFIYRRPDRFRLTFLERRPALSRLRWTVDTPEDWEMVEWIYSKLYPGNPAFTTADVLALLGETAAAA